MFLHVSKSEKYSICGVGRFLGSPILSKFPGSNFCICTIFICVTIIGDGSVTIGVRSINTTLLCLLDVFRWHCVAPTIPTIVIVVTIITILILVSLQCEHSFYIVISISMLSWKFCNPDWLCNSSPEIQMILMQTSSSKSSSNSLTLRSPSSYS